MRKNRALWPGAAILSASTLLVKILGLLFSIPLANVIDDRAMSYFYTAYDIFGVFLVLSTAGLPVAVSRMVGTAYAQGRQKEADRVVFRGLWLFFTIGLLGCLAMFFGAVPIAEFSGNPRADKAVMALAPTMFFISIMSALRGYFQGRSNMVPTAVSQIIEATTKVFIGVGLAAFIISRYQTTPGPPWGPSPACPSAPGWAPCTWCATSCGKTAWTKSSVPVTAWPPPPGRSCS